MKTWDAILLPWSVFCFILVLPVSGPLAILTLSIFAICKYIRYVKQKRIRKYIVEHELPDDFFPHKDMKKLWKRLMWYLDAYTHGRDGVMGIEPFCFREKIQYKDPGLEERLVKKYPCLKDHIDFPEFNFWKA